MAEEIILWANSQFHFIDLPDDLATGSSIMPQKKNPDGAELVRGQSSLIIGNLSSLLIILKGLPLAYSKDLQEDKKLVFKSYDTVILSLKVMNELWLKIKFNSKNMLEAVNKSNATASDLADWIVQELDLSFREAYLLTGKIIAYANNNNKKLKDLSLTELKTFNRNISNSAKKVLSSVESIKNKTSFGGTSTQSVKKTIQYAIKKYL
tara:strand:- start:169 stop:792 length:624 start_codon:yes stop_codon:yes gene_type:complete